MLNLKSLREQVYQYLREEMHNGNLLPGSMINISEVSKKLGISKSPLRDALIQLEVEGFVTILPRKSVRVNALTLNDIKDDYEIIGALEASVIMNVFDRFEKSNIRTMKQLNANMKKAMLKDDFDSYYNLNLELHNVYLNMSDNKTLIKLVEPIKQRLYDFPRRGYLKKWELRNIDEHQQFIQAVEKGNRDKAASVMRDVHWSFPVQEKYIRQFYDLVSEQIRNERILNKT